MDRIRTFVAIDLNDEIKKNIDQFIEQIRTASSGIRWVSVENIHLTIKFLGNIFAKDHDKLYRGLEMAVRGTEKIVLGVKGTGVFPNIKTPRVLWIGVEGETDKLCGLQSAIENQLEQEGFPREERSFSPHITIGRFKRGARLEKLEKILTNFRDSQFGKFVVSSLKVYRSDLTPAGPEYSLLKEIKFGKII